MPVTTLGIKATGRLSCAVFVLLLLASVKGHSATAWAALGSHTPGVIVSQVLSPSGDLYTVEVARYSLSNYSHAAAHLWRWDGSTWTDLAWPSTGGVSTDTPAFRIPLAVDQAGAIYVADDSGIISTWNGASWSTVVDTHSNLVFDLASAPGGLLYISGNFGVWCWNGTTMADLTNWGPVGPGSYYGVYGLIVDSSGHVIAVGNFSQMGSTSAASIASWDGNAWSAFGSGLTGYASAGATAPGHVYSVAIDPAGHVFASGEFQNAGSAPSGPVARWDGANWTGLGSSFGTYGNVPYVAALGVDHIMVSGGYEWNAGAWTSAAGAGRVFSVDGAGNLIVGGNFDWLDVAPFGGTGLYATDAAIRFARTKATPVIAWANPADITYGTVLSATQLNATSSGVAGSFTYSPLPGVGLSAGNHQTLNVTFTPTDTANYNAVVGSAQINVLKKTLTVTADPKSRTYGVIDPAFTVSYGGFANGEVLGTSGVTGTPSFTVNETVTSPVGGYTITPAADSLAAGNYSFAFATGALTVAPAALTISADGQSMTVGAAIPALTATYSGFVNGDTITSLAAPAVLTTTATAASPVGIYPITVTGATDANYAITVVDGTLTITPGAGTGTGIATGTTTTVNSSSGGGCGLGAGGMGLIGLVLLSLRAVRRQQRPG